MKKRLVSLAIAIITVLAITNSAYAANISNDLDSNNTEISRSVETMSNDATIRSLTNAQAYDVIDPPFGNVTMDLTLSPYVGLTKKIVINAVSETSKGILFVYLYKPNGDLASDNWVMSPNEITSWTLILPSSGTWKLQIVAGGTDEPVEVFARWE